MADEPNYNPSKEELDEALKNAQYIGTQESAGLSYPTDSPKAYALREISVRKRVTAQIVEMQERLDNLKQIHKLLNEHPEIEQLLTLMRRVGL